MVMERCFSLTDMHWVDSCPKNRTEIYERSRRLGCGVDEYGNNQYMCLPNVEKSTLVEFCYNGLMGIEYKGNCLESSNGELIRRDCSSFEFGCPEENFMKYETYKYPACQFINMKDNCYKLDPLCLPRLNISDDINNSTYTDVKHNEGSSTGYTAFLVGGVILLTLILLYVVLAYWLRKKHLQIKELERKLIRRKSQNAERSGLLPGKVQDDMQQVNVMHWTDSSVVQAGGYELNENNEVRIETQFTEDRTLEMCNLQGNVNAEEKDNRNKEIYARKMDSPRNENVKQKDKRNEEIYAREMDSLHSHTPLYAG